MAFLIGSLLEFRQNQEPAFHSNRYYWWSSIRLDRTPDRPSTVAGSFHAAFHSDDVVSGTYDPESRWVDPGPLPVLLRLSCAPAFFTGLPLVHLVAGLGLSEVWTFHVVLTVLIAGWLWLVGYGLDRAFHH